METLAEMMRRFLAPSGGRAAPAVAYQQQDQPMHHLPPMSVIQGRMTFGKMPAHVSFTPEEERSSMAYERSDSNRGELERALRDEKVQESRLLLADEYGKLFGAFDPQGAGYDYDTAVRAGIRPDATGHWLGRDPSTGVILKGASHPTFNLTEQAERDSGYDMHRDVEDGRYYSNPPVRRR